MQIIAAETPADKVEENDPAGCISAAGGIMGLIILCNTLSMDRERASMYDDS